MGARELTPRAAQRRSRRHARSETCGHVPKAQPGCCGVSFSTSARETPLRLELGGRTAQICPPDSDWPQRGENGARLRPVFPPPNWPLSTPIGIAAADCFAYSRIVVGTHNDARDEREPPLARLPTPRRGRRNRRSFAMDLDANASLSLGLGRRRPLDQQSAAPSSRVTRTTLFPSPFGRTFQGGWFPRTPAPASVQTSQHVYIHTLRGGEERVGHRRGGTGVGEVTPLGGDTRRDGECAVFIAAFYHQRLADRLGCRIPDDADGTSSTAKGGVLATAAGTPRRRPRESFLVPTVARLRRRHRAGIRPAASRRRFDSRCARSSAQYRRGRPPIPDRLRRSRGLLNRRLLIHVDYLDRGSGGRLMTGFRGVPCSRSASLRAASAVARASGRSPRLRRNPRKH